MFFLLLMPLMQTVAEIQRSPLNRIYRILRHLDNALKVLVLSPPAK
ncbi:hypothetical protein Pgy4_18079 [Pseudomonas savastanoi pv. glycinea str. race 4]|uniref:Uncharacterized protein n=1 Tax=Pseudomonas savastanoi pv. glycinea str. race 4 TaxID=875330 RepID=F3C759_PSESG|nr:hypothetical protein Pgy4_18079 [Pseudomonas savastanoi pv. glycinea str. race 4]